MNLNKAFLIGRLTNEPTLKSTKAGQSIAAFSIATTRTWSDKNKNKQEEVQYHNIVVWGRQAETSAKFLVKGQVVYIEGRIQTREYEAKDNSKRKVTEIVCESIQFGSKPAGKTMARGDEPLEEAPATGEIKPDDLPF